MRAIVAIIFSSTITVIALAQQIPIELHIHSSICIAPPDVKCTATSDDEKTQCEKCTEWLDHTFDRKMALQLDRKAYRFDTGIRAPRANHYIRDVAEQLYGIPFPTRDGNPVRIRSLYEHPERYGWHEIGPDDSRIGTIAIDKKVAGLVVAEEVTKQQAAAIVGYDLPIRRAIEDVTHRPSPSSQPASAVVTIPGVPTPPRQAPPPPPVTETETETSDEELKGTGMLYPSRYWGGELRPGLTEEVMDDDLKYLVPEDVLKRVTNQKSKPLQWNVWLADPLRPYTDRNFLDPDAHHYALMIDLAALPYTARTKPGTKTIQDLAREWLTAASNEHRTHLTAFVIVDRDYLDPGRVRTQDLEIDLDTMRDWYKAPKAITTNLATVAAAPGQRPPYTFGHVAVPIDTAGKEGETTVTLSFWDTSGRPVDEIAVPVCIAAPEHRSRCSIKQPLAGGYTGIDSVLTGVNASKPTAALHFLDTGKEVFGVFRRNDVPSDFVAWPLGDDVTRFINNLNALMTDFAEATSDKELAYLGNRLYATLFPDPAIVRSPDAKAAREAFDQFLSAHMHEEPVDGKSAPSIFVRLLQQSSSGTRVIPFGLLAPREKQTAKATAAKFIGYYFRIENPLDLQRYTADADCIVRWIVVIPPEKSDLAATRTALLPWCEGAERVFDRMRPPRKPDKDHPPFREWVFPEESEKNSALVILSHHDFINKHSRLGFDTVDYIESDEFHRRFATPSIALLNACGTAQPGSEDILNQLNLLGVQTIIATKHTIDARMAAQFVACFAPKLPRDAREAHDHPLAYAYFDAVKCLRDKTPAATDEDPKPVPWGPRALAYSLLGNGSVNLCAPHKDRPVEKRP